MFTDMQGALCALSGVVSDMMFSRALRGKGLWTSLLLTGVFFPATAEAHVKWFCAYAIAGSPEGLSNVLCQDFEGLVFLAIGVLFAGALIDRTFVGDRLTRVLDRVAGPFEASNDVILRGCVGFFLVAIWTLGGIILTPEMTTTSTVIPWMQLAFAACLLSRKTLIVAALGLVFLFGVALENYGAFHVADYPIFLGIAAYLGAIGLGRNIFGKRPLDVLRWSTAITLMWASVEKWAFPEWSYPLFVSHPGMSMGFDPVFYMRAAGVVEFSMSFALIWTPLVRRCGAIMLAATFITAIVGFGKVDAIGHAPIIGVLFMIIADRATETAKVRRLALMPLQYGGALAAFIGLYYIFHAVTYGQSIV